MIERTMMNTQIAWLKTLKRTPSPFDIYKTGSLTNSAGAREYIEKQCAPKTDGSEKNKHKSQK